MSDFRSELLKKYNVGAAGKTGSPRQEIYSPSNPYGQQQSTDYRTMLLDKYSPEKTESRQKAVSDWATRFDNVMQGISNPRSKFGNWYTRSAIDSFGSDIDSLIRDYGSIKDYAGRLGIPNAQRYLKQLQEVQSQIQRENGWYQKYRGSGYNEVESALSGMIAGDERSWLEDNRYDVYKTASDYRQRVQSGMDAFEASKPKDREEESWFEAIGRYLGKVSDTTMALGDTGRMSQEYRKDTKYKEPAENWTEDQRNTYGYLYSINPEAASDFAVKTSENYRRAENQQKLGAIQEWATKNGKNTTAGTVAAIAMMPLSLADTLNALTEYNARGTISTPSSPTPGQISEAITGSVGQSLNEKHGTISEKIPVIGGKGLGDAYQLGTSIANSLLSAYTQGSVGTDILFFGSAASSSMYSAKDRGATDEQAIKLGVLSGLAEAAGEHFSIEGLIGMSEANTMKAFFGNVLKQSGIEASEEGFTTLMNNFADQLIMGKDSAFYDKVRTYMSENGMSEQEAKKQAWKDMAEDLAFDMVGGAISGGVSTGIQTGAQKIFGGTEQAQTHHEPLATEKPGNATELANNSTPELSKATETEEKSTPLPGNATADNAEAVTEESPAVDDKMSATESTVTKSPGKNESSSVKVGVSKMETVQQTADIESFAQQFGTQADAVRRNYMEGQDLQEYEVGFEAAYTMGRDGGKAESLNNSTLPGLKYLSQSQREIAFELGQSAAKVHDAASTAGIDTEMDTDSAAVSVAKAVEISTGESVEIARISNVDSNGGMIFELTDGRTVDSSDIQHQQSGSAVLYQAVADLGTSAEVSNKLVDIWKNNPGEVNAESYAAGMIEAFNYGRYSIPQSEMAQSEAIQALTEAQRNTAYQLGKAHGSELAQTKEANIRRAGAVAKAQKTSGAAAQKTATAVAADSSKAPTTGTGKVHFDRRGRTLSAVQETGLKTMEQLSQLFGTEFHVYESYEKDGKRVFRDENGVDRDAPNGWYDPETGHIHIDLNAGSGGRGTMLFTVAHELTHYIRDWSPAKFDKLAEAVFELVYKEKNIRVVDLVRKQQAKAARNGMDLSFDEAYEEVVADSMESILTSGNVVELMAEVKQQDQSLWQKIRKWFQNLAEDIRKMIDAYAGYKPDSAEGRAVAAMADVLPILEGFYMDALQEASGNYQAAAGQKNTTQEGGRKNSFAGREAVTADRSALQQAEQMQEQGAANETIRLQTGWYKGMDGKWRYEIDDSQMEISKTISNYMRLGDLMQHEKLFAAYPDLADIDVVFQSLDTGVNGSYHPQFDSINLSYKLKNDPIGLKDALVHEIQHAIQHREGFTNGATVASWERKIKAGFDSRRAADIRKAQETELELRRIQKEEPEFYRDMVELDAMTPDLPRGEIDWETLEKIEDDPVEWQQYDARREELEAKYGDTKVWDMNDLLYQREQAAKNVGRTGVELYFDTAGEIEARDASNRRSKSQEQRKSSPPRLGNEDTVFAEGTAPADDYIPGIVSEKEIADNINAIAEMESVVSIKGDEFKMGDGRLLTDVTAFFESIGGSVYNSRLGDVYLRKRGVKHDLGHGMSDEKAASFAAIPAVLEHGQVAGFVVNKGGKGFDSATVVAPITIGNEPYMMGVIVHRSNKENRFYVHDVVSIKEEAAPLITGTHNVGETGGATSTISIIRRILDVKRNADKKTDASVTSESRNDSTDRQLASYEETTPFMTGTQNLGESGSAASVTNINGKSHGVKAKQVETGKKFSHRDSNGTELTDAQAEYFHDSKVRDTDGNLLVMHHGTKNGDFTVFDRTRATKKTGFAAFGRGNYFTIFEEGAKHYGKRVITAYLNIKNPLLTTAHRGAFVSDVAEALGINADKVSTQTVSANLKKAGYDGVIIRGIGEDEGHIVMAVTYDSAQIKNTDNLNPTDDPDIRYSQRDPLQEKAVKALEKENSQLKEDVSQLRDLLKLQKKLTGGKMVKPSSVEAAARVLKKTADATGDTKELAKLLGEFYAYIANGEELTWEGVQESAQGAADWLWNNRKQTTDEYSAEILRDLRTRGVSFNEDQKAEAAVTHDTFANYRKALFGSVKITENGMPLDEAWHELSGLYPGVFPEDTNSGDMPRALVDIVARLRNSDGTYMGYNEILALQSLIRDVYDSYWNVSTLYTVADVKQKEINALKSRHAQRMSDLRTKHREKVEQLHLEQKAAIEAVRAAERQRSQERTRKVLDKHRENQKQVAANRAERREKTEVRRKIRKAVMELDKLLNRGDKKKNVKDGMSEMVSKSLKLAEALFMDEYSNRDMLRNGVGIQMTDAEEKLFREAQQLMESIESGAVIEGMEFDGEIDAMEQMKKLDGKLSGKMAKLKDVFARERKRLYGTTVSELLGQLADEYSRLSEAEDGAVRAAKDENVYAHLLQLQKDVGGTTVRDMSLSQLEQVADAFTMVLTTVRNANKMFAKNLKFKRDTLAGMVMTEVGSRVKKISKLIRPGKNAVDTFSWNNLKPVYAFERLGSETLKTLYQNIRNGQDVWSRDMQEADDFRREQYRKHGWKKWDPDKLHSFEFESGKVELNLGQIMSLYAYSRREQALDHLLKGGFVFSGSTEVMVKEHGIQRRYLKKDATAYNLTADELLQVIDTLTKEQKAFVEEMQTYLSDVMGGKGNEISLQMYGIKSYGEKNYFPIRSAGQYMERAKEDSFRKEQGQISIVNSGFTKSTTPKANNPITLDGFMNVWAEHVNEMSMYHGFALPMEDFRRVYNYSSPNMEVGNSQSVNAVIENAFGKAATGYIDQLYKDLNGGALTDNREGISKKLVGLHKKAAVFASASVVIQQPSAIVRAFALIDPKHFIGPKVDRKRHKLLWEEVKKYAPVAFVKEMGYFDTGMGRSARDFLQAEEYSGIREKMTALFKDADYRDEILGKAPALADELTWCSIWEAVKRETKAKNPDLDVRSDTFLKIAGERFSEVIDKTQVYDSVLSRSANMRSKSGLMNMVTSFMAEPTTSINMLEDALRSGDRQQLKRTVGAVYGSVLLNSMLVSLVYAARDDDEDETWWEKYLSSVAVEMVDGINPITYYPFLRDVWSIGQGFDVERADMSLISDFADAAKNVISAGMKLRNAEESEEAAAMEKFKDSLWSMTDTVASLTGLPVKNIRRDIDGARNLVKTIGADLAGRKTTDLSLQDAVLADVMNSIPIGGLLYSKNKRDRLYGALVAGDAAYVQRLKSGYESDNAYHSAIKMALRDNDSRIWEAAVAWNSGDMETYIRIAKEIRSENRFEQDDIVLAIRAEANSMLESESESASTVKGYFTNEKFGVALSQNNTGMADIIRKDLIDTAMANGKTREKAEESVRNAARTQLKQLYAEGTVTGANAEKMLVKYGDYDQADAADRVAEWQYEKDHPELDGRITYTQYKRWEADGKSRGVALDTFTDVAEYQDSGTSGSNRSQAEVADYINRLPISTAQKDALWCCFWKESTLYKNAPWH